MLRSTGSRVQASVVVAHRLSSSGIFPDQGSNPCPLRWQADSLPLSHQESPIGFFCILFKNFIRVQSLYSVVLASDVQQSESLYIYTYPLVFRFSSHFSHYRASNRVPCAYSRFSLVICFIHSLNSYLFYT